jgi:hypothetical protein
MMYMFNIGRLAAEFVCYYTNTNSNTNTNANTNFKPPKFQRMLRLWVGITLGIWMFVCCECYMLSCRGLCDRLITSPEESYRLYCVYECDLETS